MDKALLVLLRLLALPANDNHPALDPVNAKSAKPIKRVSGARPERSAMSAPSVKDVERVAYKNSQELDQAF